MSSYDALHPYFYKPQAWQVYAILGVLGFLAFWQVKKWKIDRETYQDRWFEKEAKKYLQRKAKEEAEQQAKEEKLINPIGAICADEKRIKLWQKTKTT